MKICPINLNKKAAAKTAYTIFEYLNFLFSTSKKINIIAAKDKNTYEVSLVDIYIVYFIGIDDKAIKALLS